MEAVTVVWVRTTTELDHVEVIPLLLERIGQCCIDGSVCMGDLEQNE